MSDRYDQFERDTSLLAMSDSELYDYLVLHAEILQDKEEILGAMAAIRSHFGSPVNILVEIGSKYGGSVTMLSKLVLDSGRIFSIDNNMRLNYLVIKRIVGEQRFIPVRGQSQDPRVVHSLVNILRGTPIDILHIDGCHDSKYELMDFEVYGRLVRKGGIIMVHDISSAQCKGLPELYAEVLCNGRRHQEFISESGENGIGVLYI
jgi:cephalosporin hydroxylase